MKSMGKNFLIYTKKNNVYGELKKTNLKFFYFLLKQNLIFPFFKKLANAKTKKVSVVTSLIWIS